MRTQPNTAQPAQRLFVALVLASLVCARADIFSFFGGTASPPANVGPYVVTSFGDDTRPADALVGSVPSPLSGDVVFSLPLFHTEVPTGWSTWSHGYTGDVYYDLDGGLSVELTMPADTAAFHLSAQPEPLQSFLITVFSQDGTSITEVVDGNGGASVFGFYATGSDLISSINISSEQPFAIGEFGIAGPRDLRVPDSSQGVLVLAAFGLIAFGWHSKRHSSERIRA